jgi:peptidoglycan-associated lipoprotein
MNRLNWVTVISMTFMLAGCSNSHENLITPKYIQNGAEKTPLTLKITRQYHFDLNQTRLDATSEADLSGYAEYLKQNPNTLVRIEGHADINEPAHRLIMLSTGRANAIAQLLLTQGVSRAQIDIKIYGSHQQLSSAPHSQQNNLNRRAVLSFEMSPDTQVS